jgi:plasmid stability protein
MTASRRATARAETTRPARRPAKHLTVRNVPDDVARALAVETRKRGESVNRAVIGLLRQALGMDPGAVHDNGLERLAGTWSAKDLAVFEEATRCFEAIDEDLWRGEGG